MGGGGAKNNPPPPPPPPPAAPPPNNNINTTSILWGNSQLFVGRQDLNLNVSDCIYLGQESRLIGNSDPPCLYSIFADGTCVKSFKKKGRGALHMDAEKGPDLEWSVPSLVEITNWLRVGKHMF